MPTPGAGRASRDSITTGATYSVGDNPHTAAICSSVTAPGRYTTIFSGSSTVDSTPTFVAPPSTTASMRPSRSASTCAAVVGLVCPNVFALGAAKGTPVSRSNSSATGCDGIRTPTSGRPAVTASGMFAFRGSSSVSGPGQKASASARTRLLTSAMVSTCAASARCTISGSHAGRCLAAKMRATASSSSAFAPRP